MKFLLYPNRSNPAALTLCERAGHFLRQNGHTVLLAAGAEGADMLLVFGGDGTLLRAVHELHAACPVWCVNCGHLGYLTDCELAQAEAVLPRLLAGDYHLEKRMLMRGALNDQPEFTALNEMVLHRGAYQHALYLHLYVNDQLAMRLHGDGLIVSTPTGSTAYNLSAGGPVLMPEARLLAVTPICAHAPSGVPMVVSAQDTVRVQWLPAYDAEEPDMPYLVVDGLRREPLRPRDSVTLRCGTQSVLLVRTGDEAFCQRLQGKLRMSGE